MLAQINKDWEDREKSPETSLWIENRSGEQILEVSVHCEAKGEGRSMNESGTDQRKVDEKPTKVWWQKYPEPITVKTLELRFAGGSKLKYPLEHQCKVGEEVTVEIDQRYKAIIKRVVESKP